MNSDAIMVPLYNYAIITLGPYARYPGLNNGDSSPYNSDPYNCAPHNGNSDPYLFESVFNFVENLGDNYDMNNGEDSFNRMNDFIVNNAA